MKPNKGNIIYLCLVIVITFVTTTLFVSSNDLSFAIKDDSKSKKKIELCCAWGDSLNDGVLTFSITNGGSDLAKIVKLAIQDCNADSDIQIEFKKGKGKKVGKAVTFFDHLGLIDHVEISISKKSYGVTLDKPTLEHVAKHEFGHALGIGHAEFENSLMSPNVDELITKMSACELESVKYANSWKFIEDDSPSPLDKANFKCKNK